LVQMIRGIEKCIILAMEAAFKILSVAIGGAFGAVARYLINISPLAGIFDKFPLPTFLINITGSFLIGFLMIIFADKADVNENVRMAVIVGFLGAFTTFSTFEVEIYAIARERDFVTGFLYLFLSIFVGFVGVVAGVALGRRV
jgi:fluoride exporter